MRAARHDRWIVLSLGFALGCGPGDGGTDGGPSLDAATTCPDASAPITPEPQEHTVLTGFGAGPCALTLSYPEPRVIELWVEGDGAELSLDGRGLRPYEPPLRVEAGAHTVEVVSDAAGTRVHVRDHGPVPTSIRIERSLTWTDAALLDDAGTVGLGRVMAAASVDGHGGRLLEHWFGRFATTAHSERLGPQRLLDEIAASQGTDTRMWDLDAAPFVVTGVHNRIDLADGDACGELRVSLASTHPIHQPFHMILLLEQPARPEDRRPDGGAHCVSTALAWARLSELDDESFREAARRMLDEALVRERVLVLETVELLISPWEWRQWFLESNDDPATRDTLPEVLENRPLFQTVDAATLSTPSPERDAFIAWVTENAGPLDARTIEIPEAFRSPSARVNDGVPWIPLDLTGVPQELLDEYPSLRQNIEIVGCPACHAADADFVQTLPDRTFSPFYVKELDARSEYLGALAEGLPGAVPFGPLQATPVLTP